MTSRYPYDQELGNIDVFCNMKVKREQRKVRAESRGYALGTRIDVCKEPILACKLSAEV